MGGNLERWIAHISSTTDDGNGRTTPALYTAHRMLFEHGRLPLSEQTHPDQDDHSNIIEGWEKGKNPQAWFSTGVRTEGMKNPYAHAPDRFTVPPILAAKAEGFQRHDDGEVTVWRDGCVVHKDPLKSLEYNTPT